MIEDAAPNEVREVKPKEVRSLEGGILTLKNGERYREEEDLKRELYQQLKAEFAPQDAVIRALLVDAVNRLLQLGPGLTDDERKFWEQRLAKDIPKING
jgi:hypothetical protein